MFSRVSLLIALTSNIYMFKGPVVSSKSSSHDEAVGVDFCNFSALL